MVVDERPGVELVEQLLVPHAAQEPRAGVGQSLHPAGVVVGVGGRADDDERPAGRRAGVAIDDDIDVVLDLEARHHQVVAARLQVQLGQPVGARGHLRSAVGDELGGGGELPGVVVGDAPGVGDQGVGVADREGLRRTVVAPAGRSPLAALPLQAVHMRGHRDAGGAQCGQEGRVGGVEDEGDVRVDSRQQVRDRGPGMGEGLQAAAPHGGQLDHAHASVEPG